MISDWLKQARPLSKMTRKELRIQELKLQRERTRMLKLVEKLAKEKQGLFERGAKETMPEVRRMLAQEFEMKTTEQLMTARHLNIRSKEMLTVSRLRMLRENADRAKSTGGKLGLVGEKDIIQLGKLIENDNITTEVYQDRLDSILSVCAVEEGAAGLSDAGQTVMNIWDKMDTGTISDAGEAFDEADRRVREQQAAGEQ